MKKLIFSICLAAIGFSVSAQSFLKHVSSQAVDGFYFHEDLIDSLSYEYDWDGTSWVMTSKDSSILDSYGNISKEYYYNDVGQGIRPESYVVNSHNSTGQLIEETYYYYNTDLGAFEASHRESFTYDGELYTGGFFYHWNGTNWETHQKNTGLYYNSNSLLVITREALDPATLQVQFTEKIDSIWINPKMQVTKEASYIDTTGTGNFKGDERTDYTMDSKNRATEQITYYWDATQWEPAEKEYYQYNNAGLITMHETHTWNANGWQLEETSFANYQFSPAKRHFNINIQSFSFDGGLPQPLHSSVNYFLVDNDGTFSNSIIEGTISLPAGISSKAYENMQVKLYDATGSNLLQDSIFVDSTGRYTLIFEPDGNYLLKATLKQPGLNPTLMGTFYGDAIRWGNAQVLNLTFGDAITANINMQNLSPLAKGNGTISGQLVFAAATKQGISTKSAGATGEPVPGAEIILEQEPDDNPVGYTISSADGSYSFDSIPEGSYSIAIDMPGIPQLSTYQVDMDSQGNATIDGQAITDFDFAVDTVEGTLGGQDTANVTSVKTYTGERFTLKVYPNPIEEQIMLEYQLQKAGKLSIRLVGMNGVEHYYSQKYQEAGSYSEATEINTAGLAPGIYMLIFCLDEECYIKKMVKN